MATVSRPRSIPARHQSTYDRGPWYRAAKKAWYITIKDESAPSGQRQVKLSTNEAEAQQKWHGLQSGLLTLADIMAPSRRSTEAMPLVLGEAMKVGDLVNEYIGWQENRVSEDRQTKNTITPHRFKIVQRYATALAKFMGNETIADVRVGGVARIESWLNTNKGWDGCLGTVVATVKQVFLFGSTGVKNGQGFYSTSPIKGLERPADNRRESVFTEEQVQAILSHGTRHFKEAFKALLATGCRPGELANITAKNVKVDDAGELYWELAMHKTKKKTGRSRRIYLTDEMQELTRRLMKQNPTGPLFRNRFDKPEVSKSFVNASLKKICRKHEDCQKLGLSEVVSLRKGKKVYKKNKYVAYTCRHTFAFRYLTGFYRDAHGEPIILGYAEVAQYLGNSAQEVEDTYGHMVDP
jgi:integrase